MEVPVCKSQVCARGACAREVRVRNELYIPSTAEGIHVVMNTAELSLWCRVDHTPLCHLKEQSAYLNDVLSTSTGMRKR